MGCQQWCIAGHLFRLSACSPRPLLRRACGLPLLSLPTGRQAASFELGCRAGNDIFNGGNSCLKLPIRVQTKPFEILIVNYLKIVKNL